MTIERSAWHNEGWINIQYRYIRIQNHFPVFVCDVTPARFVLVSDDTSHTSITVSSLGIRKGKRFKFFLTLTCFAFELFDLHLRKQEALIIIFCLQLIRIKPVWHISEYLITSVHVHRGESFSLFTLHKNMPFYLANSSRSCSEYWEEISWNLLRSRCTLLSICRFGFSCSLLRHRCLFFCILCVCVCRSTCCSSLGRIISAATISLLFPRPPIMPLNWSYSWTGWNRFPILKNMFLLLLLLPHFCIGAWALRQFLPPVHQLFERENANRSSNRRAGWQL